MTGRVEAPRQLLPNCTALNQRFTIIWLLLLVVHTAGACASTSVEPSDEPPVGPISEPEPDEKTPRAVPPPFVAPPQPADEIWKLPDYGRRQPPFPFLPGEDRRRSRSVGTVTDGFLVNGRPVSIPHPHIAFLPRQFERRLIYTSDAMVELLDDAAHHVAEFYPDAVVYLGNLSAQGGGNIPHSVSHNNGRDADIAFFVLDEEGNPAAPPDLLPMDRQGRFEGSAGDHAEFVLQFDVERNWRFVEGLIESDAADIQFIFVSNPLRRMLLAEARRQNASRHVLRIAQSVLVQPGGQSLPHDDHFHVRIHCTARDLASGCRERGRAGPTFDADYGAADRIIALGEELLDDENPYWRRTALLRLNQLENHDLHRSFVDLVDDADPSVRAAAARVLSSQSFATNHLVARLEVETDPHVLAELIEALVDHGAEAVEPLIAALEFDERLVLTPMTSLPLTVIVADALARLERPEPVPYLIAALEKVESRSRPAIAHALRILTNHRFAFDGQLRDEDSFAEVVEAWLEWWDDQGERDRDEWVAEGFRRAGFEVTDLGRTDVWELCRAIEDDRHLNFNAQRRLQHISGTRPESLRWSAYDASFFWRRWFERRQDSFGLPPIPEELSTADGYNPPQ